MADRTHARSMVISLRGIVATSQTLASQAGAQMLARGGSAVDAAIAANATLAVVEPMACGIGGDLFAIYWDAASRALTGLNASGWAPQALTMEFLKSRNYVVIGEEDIHAVSVPGCVNGWESLHRRFGRLDWTELFQPAIYHASCGFPVTELIQQVWSKSSGKLNRNEYGSSVFLRSGAAPCIGESFRNPDLARALQLIAEAGADAFYDGPIAEALLRTSASFGGTLAAADLTEFQSEWVTPISTPYRDWRIFELPPNSQGVTALEMLNILETFPLSDYACLSAEALHWKIEAQKLAFQDLGRYIADPRHAHIPTAGLLSKSYAAARAALISPDKATSSPTPGNPPAAAGNTIYLSVVDAEGNIVSLIQSIAKPFGTGIAVPGMGFHLHNRSSSFSLDPGHPNALIPRKRPLHTIIPAFMMKGDLHIGFGIMGGFAQPQAHAQFVCNLVDHGMNLQAALDAPRFVKLDFGGCDVIVEGRVPPGVREELTRRGHRLDLRADYDDIVGGGQAVMRNVATGTNYGASCARKDGAAIPEPAPPLR